jgi:hypothetical protein
MADYIEGRRVNFFIETYADFFAAGLPSFDRCVLSWMHGCVFLVFSGSIAATPAQSPTVLHPIWMVFWAGPDLRTIDDSATSPPLLGVPRYSRRKLGSAARNRREWQPTPR